MVARITVFIFIGVAALLLGKSAFGQLNYNQTTGNYIDDPDDPNNAENIIIKYCFDHADRVSAGENVVQTLVNASLVPIFYDGKTCSDVQKLHEEGKFQQRVGKAQDSLRESLFNNGQSETDKLQREFFKMLPDDVKEEILKDLSK